MEITQENNKCWLCGDRDATINHIVCKYSKLAPQKSSRLGIIGWER